VAFIVGSFGSTHGKLGLVPAPGSVVREVANGG
jgi:hypothetical protein